MVLRLIRNEDWKLAADGVRHLNDAGWVTVPTDFEILTNSATLKFNMGKPAAGSFVALTTRRLQEDAVKRWFFSESNT